MNHPDFFGVIHVFYRHEGCFEAYPYGILRFGHGLAGTSHVRRHGRAARSSFFGCSDGIRLPFFPAYSLVGCVVGACGSCFFFFTRTRTAVCGLVAFCPLDFVHRCARHRRLGPPPVAMAETVGRRFGVDGGNHAFPFTYRTLAPNGWFVHHTTGFGICPGLGVRPARPS